MHLEHFNHKEFGHWFIKMSARLLVLLDLLRYRVNAPIEISAHPKALGRHLGAGDMSAHNVDEWGVVYAADVFIAGVHTEQDARRVYNRAVKCGFTGIGVYSQTTNNDGNKQVMFHLDTRPNRDMGNPATWGRIGNEWTSLEAALQDLPSR